MRIQKSYDVAAGATNTTAAAGVSTIGGLVRLAASVPCYMALNAPATTTSTFIPQNWPEQFQMIQGDVINVLAVGTTGFLNVTEFN